MTSYLAVVDMTEFEEPLAETQETSARAGAGRARVGVVKALREQGAARGCLAAERSALG